MKSAKITMTGDMHVASKSSGNKNSKLIKKMANGDKKALEKAYKIMYGKK